MKRNSLTGKGVHHIHALSPSGRRRFREIVGRDVRPDDYEGVHTTSDHNIASSYAISAWKNGPVTGDCPVVVHLDTSGLTPLPDVDAMMIGTELYSAIRESVRRFVIEGLGADSIIHMFNSYEFESEIHNLTGEDPASAIYDDVYTHPGNPIEILVSHSKHGPEQAILRFVERGEVPGQALSEIVRQRRFDFEFEVDRVKRIDCIRPWWKEIIDEEDSDTIEIIENAGWSVVTFDDAASFSIRAEYNIIYGSEDSSDDMHGTTMSSLRAAFPILRDSLPCVFDVEPEELVEERIEKAKGADDDGDDDDY